MVIISGAALITSTVIVGSTQAWGRDLDLLADYLARAYTAMNFAAFCSVPDPSYEKSIRGQRGTPFDYAEHVKGEVSSNLSEVDAAAIWKSAADKARAIARLKLHELATEGDDVATARAVTSWCSSEGRVFILTFIRSHDYNHAMTERMLDQAKR